VTALDLSPALSLGALETPPRAGELRNAIPSGKGRIDTAEYLARVRRGQTCGMASFLHLASVEHSRDWQRPAVCAVIGGGPSLADELPALRRLIARGAKTIAVNKSHDWLLLRNLPCHYAVLLDPKDWVAGYIDLDLAARKRAEALRSGKFDKAARARVADPLRWAETRFLIASQCHDDVIAKFKDQPHAYMWHAAAGLGESEILKTEFGREARGELVIPEALQNPEVLSAIRRAAAQNDIAFDRLRVGSAGNSINPNTGLPEFASDMSFARVPLGRFGAFEDGQRKFSDMMRDRADLISALHNPKVQAGLDTISQTEGNTNYASRYGNNPPITDFSKHPAPGTVGTPSGRYQIDARTYNDIAPKIGITDFSPQSQDLMAAYLLKHAGEGAKPRKGVNFGPNALESLRDGNMGAPIARIATRWASIPEGPNPEHKGWYYEGKDTYNLAKPYGTVMQYYDENLKRQYRP